MRKGESASVEVYRAGGQGAPPRLAVEYAPAAWSYGEEARHYVAISAMDASPVTTSWQITSLTDGTTPCAIPAFMSTRNPPLGYMVDHGQYGVRRGGEGSLCSGPRDVA